MSKSIGARADSGVGVREDVELERVVERYCVQYLPLDTGCAAAGSPTGFAMLQ